MRELTGWSRDKRAHHLQDRESKKREAPEKTQMEEGLFSVTCDVYDSLQRVLRTRQRRAAASPARLRIWKPTDSSASNTRGVIRRTTRDALAGG